MARLTQKIRRRRPDLNRGEILDALAAFRDLQATALVVHVSRTTTLVAYDHPTFDRLLEILGEPDADFEPEIASYREIAVPGGAVWASNDDREADVHDEPHDEDADAEPDLGWTAAGAASDNHGSTVAWGDNMEANLSTTAGEDRWGVYAPAQDDEVEERQDEDRGPIATPTFATVAPLTTGPS